MEQINRTELRFVYQGPAAFILPKVIRHPDKQLSVRRWRLNDYFSFYMHDWHIKRILYGANNFVCNTRRVLSDHGRFT